MLVGWKPINAYPPQQSIEVKYYCKCKHPRLWARAITTNSKDFRPLLHIHSTGKVGRDSVGLFYEDFVDKAYEGNAIEIQPVALRRESRIIDVHRRFDVKEGFCERRAETK